MEYLRFIFSSIVTLIINFKLKENDKPVKKILLVRLDNIGDMVCSFEAIHNVHREYGFANIKLVTGIWNKELFINTTLIDDLIVYNSPTFTRNNEHISTWKDKIKLYKNLRTEKFDFIIDFRSDLFLTFISLLLNPRIRLDRGTIRLKNKISTLLNKIKKTGKKISVHEIETNKEIVMPLIKEYKESQDFFRFSKNEVDWLNIFFEKHKLKPGSYSVLHPGAPWEFRRWHYNNFRKIGDYLFRKFDLKSIIIGTKDEFELGNKISKDNLDKFINLVGETALRQVILIIMNAAIVVCNDSGPMHLASVLGVSTVAIVGPGDMGKFAPQGKNSLYFHKKLECNPCGQVKCKYPERPCVNLNTVAEVEKGIEFLLAKEILK